MVNEIIVADTSVLINFLRIDRMDLIGAHPASFITTDNVAAEIVDIYPHQQARYAAALTEDDTLGQRSVRFRQCFKQGLRQAVPRLINQR